MSAQTIAKAKQYLSDGKVKPLVVSDSHARFSVQGSATRPYSVNASNVVGWECDCPAQTECAHILACKLICDIKAQERVSLFESVVSIQDLFAQV